MNMKMILRKTTNTQIHLFIMLIKKKKEKLLSLILKWFRNVPKVFSQAKKLHNSKTIYLDYHRNFADSSSSLHTPRGNRERSNAKKKLKYFPSSNFYFIIPRIIKI